MKEAIQKHIALVNLWETNQSMDDPSNWAMSELLEAYKQAHPNAHVDNTCRSCLARIMNEIVDIKNNLKFHTF